MSKPFRHYSVRHRMVAWVSQNLFDRATYTVRRGLLRGMRRKGGLAWIPGSGLSQEHAFLDSLDLAGKVVYDVGAFHGLLTMFFASRARAVVAYEPNSVNRARLEENLALNDFRAIVRPVGVGSQASRGTISWSPLTPGGGSIAQRGPGLTTEDIEIVALDQDIEGGLPSPDFIKIDIEGLELEALRGARQTLTRLRPALFLEMHGETMDDKKRKVREIVEFIQGLGYRLIVHVESGTAITPGNADVAAQGHLYVS